MSNVLLSYAQNIESANNNLNHANAASLHAAQNAAEQSRRSFENLQQILAHHRQLALEKQKLNQERENAVRQSQENSKMMRLLTLMSHKDKNGKTLEPQEAMGIIEAQDAKALQELRATEQKHYTPEEIALGAVGAVGKGAYEAGKWGWKQTTKAARFLKGKNQERAFINEQAQTLHAGDKSAQKQFKRELKDAAKFDKNNGTNTYGEILANAHEQAKQIQQNQQKYIQNTIQDAQAPLGANIKAPTLPPALPQTTNALETASKKRNIGLNNHTINGTPLGLKGK